MNVKRNAALFFRDLGFPIIPCVPNSLRIVPPLCVCDATLQADVIRQWWQRWPEANIGIRCDDIVVFDIATKADVLKLGKLDPPVQKLPHGGYQAFFKRSACDEPPRCPGVHSGARAYVVVGPSCTSRGMIKWIRPVGLLETWPEWTLLQEEKERHACASV